MSRNIVICCDGTANQFAQDNTNVVKLYYTLVQDPARQITFYHPGVGTMEPVGALTTIGRKVTMLLGMAIGYGLSNDIRDAYAFLMENFHEDDKVYLFGFSRGAYTARAVAALLHGYGLLRPGNEPLVPYAIRMMMGISRARRDRQDEKDAAEKYFGLAQDFRATMARNDCKPHFVGVWDTVSSVGWLESPLKLPYVTSNPDINIGRHAVSIDEHRAFFRNHLWRRQDDQMEAWGPQDVKQVWFPGVHCDVGGGYPEKESGLSKIALKWMLDEAMAAGLLVDEHRMAEVLGKGGNKKYETVPDPNGLIHTSLHGPWHIAELIPKEHYDWKTKQTGRKINFWKRRTIPTGSLVHPAAWQRSGDYAKRLPADAVNLDDWEKNELQKKAAAAGGADKGPGGSVPLVAS